MYNKIYKNVNKKLLEFGVGEHIKNIVLKTTGVNTRKKCHNYKLKTFIKLEKIKRRKIFGKKLINKIKERKKFLIDLNTFKGLRHQLRKPVRGQRTKTNAKTSRKVNILNGKNSKNFKKGEVRKKTFRKIQQN